MSDFRAATKAVIYHPGLDKYLILKKSNLEDVNPDTYDFPGGGIGFGEKLEVAVVREVKEETGLDVFPHRVFNAWTFVDTKNNVQLIGVDFICFTHKKTVKLSFEHSGFEWESVEEIVGNPKYPDWLKNTIIKAEEIRPTHSDTSGR